MFESDLISGILNTPTAPLSPAASQVPVNFLATLQNGLSPSLSPLVQNTAAQSAAVPDFAQGFLRSPLNANGMRQMPIQVIIINGGLPNNGLNGLPLNLNLGSLNNGVLNTSALNNGANVMAQQGAPQLNPAAMPLAQNNANALNAVQLGTIFGTMDADHNLAIDQRELANSVAGNGDPLNLAPLLAAGGGVITADAFLNRFIQLDTNHDELWPAAELAAAAGQNNLPASMLPQNAGQPQGNSGVQILPQANAAANAALPPFQNTASASAALPPFPETQPSPTAPGTDKTTPKDSENNGDAASGKIDTAGNTDAEDIFDAPDPAADPKTKDAKAKSADEKAAEEAAAGKAATEAEKNIKLRDDRWALAKKTSHAKKDSVSLMALHDALAHDDKIFDEKEYSEYAKLLGLKTSYADFDKSRKAGLSEEKALVKAVGDIDANKNKELDLKEFHTANPLPSDDDATDVDPVDDATDTDENGAAADTDKTGTDTTDDSATTPTTDEDKSGKTDTAPTTENKSGKTDTASAAEKLIIAQGKADYFKINTDRKHGVTQTELVDFLKGKVGNRPNLNAGDQQALLAALGWDKARFAKPFIKDLKPGMSVADTVDKVFRRLDHDHSGGLVRGELGDLVTGKTGHKHTNKKHKIKKK